MEAFRTRSRSRSRSRADSTDGRPHHTQILFPKVYDEAWGSTADPTGALGRSEIMRAKIFFMRFLRLDPSMNSPQLGEVLADQSLTTIPQLASAVQMRVFGGRHATFEATPLLQAMRFVLIKAQVSETMVSDRARSLIDFYFDPTMSRNLVPLPYDPVAYPYPAGRLKVVIVGGGPTALASAISLAEKGGRKVEVHMWERRWVWKQGSKGPYVDYPPTAKRRDQVVTLQDGVTSLLSERTRFALFQGRPEPVWPGSGKSVTQQCSETDSKLTTPKRIFRFEKSRTDY